MPPTPGSTPMSAEQTAVLVDFARACRTAARSVSLYPRDPPVDPGLAVARHWRGRPADPRRRRHAHRASRDADHRRPRARRGRIRRWPSSPACCTTGWSARSASSRRRRRRLARAAAAARTPAGRADRRGRHRQGVGGHRAQPLRDPRNRLRRGAARAERRRRRRVGQHHRVLPAGRTATLDDRRPHVAARDAQRLGAVRRAARAAAERRDRRRATVSARAAALLELVQQMLDATGRALGRERRKRVLQTVADSTSRLTPDMLLAISSWRAAAGARDSRESRRRSSIA